MPQSIPRTAEEYTSLIRQVMGGKSIIGRAGDYLSSVDERIDITNLLLIELNARMGGGYGGGYGGGDSSSSVLAAINSLITNLGGTAIVATPSRFIAKTIVLSTASTGQNLPSMKAVPNREIVVKAHKDNTGVIYVANDKLSSEDTYNSWPLTAGQSVGILTSNLNNIWVSADTNGDKVTYTMEVRE